MPVRTEILKYCVAHILAVGFLAAAVAAERPNIVFTLTDDMDYGDVGCYGGKFVPTPNIDRLASEGTRFAQFSVA